MEVELNEELKTQAVVEAGGRQPASEGSPGIEGKQISSMEGAPVMSGYDRGFRYCLRTLAE
ncbi:MAG: hypothetical protein ACLR0U_20855 [Enterocloster clostridioformis]